eukprot:624557-Pelagomonas_calceolata.AAC.5
MYAGRAGSRGWPTWAGMHGFDQVTDGHFVRSIAHQRASPLSARTPWSQKAKFADLGIVCG